jgi:D-sedoheptulose 7-phosphate isomerase
MGFGPPEGDPEVVRALAIAGARGAQTFALPGDGADYCLTPGHGDPFIHQEMLEILYHTLWETVHVYLEHAELGHDVGDAAFLYPFLGGREDNAIDLVAQVANSMRSKAEEDERLRSGVMAQDPDAIARAASALGAGIDRGATVLVFGNGGSATDANDFALDCVASPKGYGPVRALSLSTEPATITAIANDIGGEAIFLRQLIAHARAGDVAVAISTSGGSASIIAALEEARRRELTTVALLGYGGGEILRRGLVDFPVVVRCDYIPRIQEVHASIYHIMLDLIGAPASASDAVIDQ